MQTETLLIPMSLVQLTRLRCDNPFTRINVKVNVALWARLLHPFRFGAIPLCNQRELSTYERRQIELIETWMSSPPSYAARGIRAAKGAAGSLIRRVLPNGVVEKIGARATLMSAVVQKAIPTGAIEGAVNANLWLAHQWTREKAVLRELGIETFEDVKDLNLEQLDRLANKVHNAAIGAGGAAGAVGGAGGVVLAVPRCSVPGCGVTG